MNKGFIPIISFLIIISVIGAGVVGAVLISKTVSKYKFSEERKEIETNETPEAPLLPAAPQQPVVKPHTETYISISEKPPAQTQIQISAIDVPTPVDTIPLNLEIEKTSSPPQQEEIISCENDINPKLTADITDFSKIRKITAPGIASIEGPKGYSFIWTGKRRVPIYAPAAITLESGSYSKDTAESPAQYLLFFTVQENCNYRIKFDHIDDPISPIKEQFSAIPAIADSRTTEVQNKLTFKAGDLIGYTSGTIEASNWDFGMYNTKEEGILATQYNSYGIHGYAVCWTDFYFPDIKKQQYRKLLEGPTLVCFF